MTRGMFCGIVGLIAVVAFIVYGMFFDPNLEHFAPEWLFLPLALMIILASGGEGPGPLGYE